MTSRVSFSLSAHSITRLLVTSYFIALSVGFIPGTSLSAFLNPILPEFLAMLAVHAVVLFLACLILFGVHRRAAALLLSLVVFYSSYVALFSGGDVGAFWRDLALIGALLMTADLARMSDPNGSWDKVLEDDAPEEDTLEAVRSDQLYREDIAFREDFDIARAS